MMTNRREKDQTGTKGNQGILCQPLKKTFLVPLATPVNMPRGANIRGVRTKARKSITRTSMTRALIFPFGLAMINLLSISLGLSKTILRCAAPAHEQRGEEEHQGVLKNDQKDQ